MILSAATFGLLLYGPRLQGQQSVTPGPPIQDPVAYEKQRVQVWKAALQDSYRLIKQNLIIDLNKSELSANPPRLVLPGAREDLGVKVPVRERDIIRLSSGFLHRNPIRMKEGWAFKRDRAHSTVAQSNYELIIEWIKNAPKPELRALLGPGVPFAYLSDASQDVFSRLCYNRGLQKKMLNGEFASAEIRFSFIGNYRDQNGAQNSMILDLGSRDWNSEGIRRDKLEKAYVPPQLDPGQFGKAAEGTLEFVEGEILTIEELSKLANSAFTRTTIYDGRFGPQYVYIQGRFTKESYIKYMQALCKSIDYDYALSAAELRDQLVLVMREILLPLAEPASCPKGTTFQALFDFESVQASDLFGGFPDLKHDLAGRKLLSSQVFKLSPGLTIQLIGDGAELEPTDPPGSSPVTNSWGTTFGKVVP